MILKIGILHKLKLQYDTHIQSEWLIMVYLLIMPYLHFPQSLAWSCCSSRRPCCETKKDILYFLVFVHSKKFFLFGMKQSDNISSFQNVFFVFLVFQEQRNFPRRLCVNNINLKNNMVYIRKGIALLKPSILLTHYFVRS